MEFQKQDFEKKIADLGKILEEMKQKKSEKQYSHLFSDFFHFLREEIMKTLSTKGYTCNFEEFMKKLKKREYPKEFHFVRIEN